MQTQKPTLELLTCEGTYRDNPTALFHQLCGNRPATLLLESADIDSKDDLKSLLLIDSALRITALGDTVTIQALSGNGEALLALLDNALPAGVESEQSPNCRVLRFPPVSPLLDEDARLCSLSVFDAFRLLQNLLNVPKEEREAMFFGGLFSYDLVAGFEDLPQLAAENNCPDFCFYLAETLMVIDHQKKSTRIQASLFAPNEEEKQRLTARLNDLRQQLTEAAPPLPVVSVPHMRCECNQSDEEFGGVVRLLQKAIRAGEIFQVVPSRRFSLPCPSPLAAYYVLKKSNPSPYMFFMQDNDFTLFGASPESSLKYDATSRQIEIYPIAGTRPRGRRADGSLDRDLDSRIELEMRTDHKELSEHLMLVDLARNDLARSRSRHRVDRLRDPSPAWSVSCATISTPARLPRLYEYGDVKRCAESTRYAVNCRGGRSSPRQLRRRGRLFHRAWRSRHLHCDPLGAGGKRYRHRASRCWRGT
ncbi:hypothetical protein ECZU26_37620 [Escherichia coli]|nr:hypothetical protein ECZU26_37620 [Escherichia coli]